MRVLVLGGTTEAANLARALARDAGVQVTVSLAGRTAAPAPLPVPVRIGGFGGAQGLAAYLAAQRITAVIDATHPFAEQISRHAQVAAQAAGVPILVLRRPPWVERPTDRWQTVANMSEAAAALGVQPCRVLLTVGRQDLAPFLAAPWHRYVLRSVDPPLRELVPPGAVVIVARGPFREQDERVLFAAHDINCLVTKNSGGDATAAKLAAARAAGMRVVMVARPPMPDAPTVQTVDAALAWLAGHVSVPRGV